MKLRLSGLRRWSSPEQVRREWKRRLRSDEYTQGRTALKRVVHPKGATHCCLGVLCEIAVEAGVIKPGIVGWDGERVSFGSETAQGGWYGAPPSEVKDWAGLTNDQVGELMTANDVKWLGFSAIADLIEDMPIV